MRATGPRVLLLADTHLGFDTPMRPRVARRRRGDDFLAAYHAALRPALRGAVDVVLHGGDLFHRSRVPAAVVQAAMEPLREIADRGVQVFLVPGNHERSRFPLPLLAQHPRVHVFHRPGTVVVPAGGVALAVSGIPFVRRVGGNALAGLVERTGWRRERADVRLLCVHQAFEGARVGVQDFTFRGGRDVIPGGQVPAAFAAVLSGHIHRGQGLTHDLAGRRLAAPVLYPGSVERTSYAEREETKGYLWLRFVRGGVGGLLAARDFVPLPTRPMLVLDVDGDALDARALAARIAARLVACPTAAVVRLDVRGHPVPGATAALHAARVRALAPATMNVEVRLPDDDRATRRGGRAQRRP